MLFYAFLLFAVLTVQIEESNGKGLPSYLTACRRFDPHLNECILKVARSAASTFAKGDPALNIPSLDPLYVKEIKSPAYGTSQNNGIQILFTDIYMKGMKNLNIKKILFNIAKRKFSAKATVDLTMDSKYDLGGRLLIFPLVGKGKSKIELRDVKLSYNFNYDLVNKDGVEYLKYTTDDFKYDVGKATFNLENLFNGDKVLGEATHKLLNENWRDVIYEVSPPVADALKNGFKNAAEAFLKQVPYDELLTIP